LKIRGKIVEPVYQDEEEPLFMMYHQRNKLENPRVASTVRRDIWRSGGNFKYYKDINQACLLVNGGHRVIHGTS